MFPDGGTTGQFLAKASSTTSDVGWVDLEQATEETAGISRNATQEKVDAGEDDEDFVTPLKLGTKLANAVPALASSAGMPSGRAVNFTLGVSPALYTAPADGYVSVQIASTAPGQWIVITSGKAQWNGEAALVGSGPIVTAPVKKGQTVTINYVTAGAVGYAKFIYANGVPA